MSNAKDSSRNIKGFLIDIDGVLYTGKERIGGAIKAINYLKRHKVPFLLATNTTRRSRYSLQSYLYSMGFKVNVEQIYSTTYAARQWLIAHKIESIYLFLRGDSYREFKGFKVTANNPEYIVMGDLGDDLTYNKLNHAFQLIMGGTKMLALQRNRYWQDGSDLVIDAGAIVAALEYATQKKAIIIGKPQKDFFTHALRELSLPAQNVAIVGDDIENDIKGGKRVGLFAIAVQTGKFTEEALMNLNVRPDLLMQSIADLPDWIEENRKPRRDE